KALVFAAATAGRRRAAGRSRSASRVGLLAAGRTRRGACALIERLGQLVRCRLEVREGVVHAFDAALFQSLLRVGEGRLYLRLRRAVELLFVLAEGLLDLVDESVQTVARLYLLAPLQDRKSVV